MSSTKAEIKQTVSRVAAEGGGMIAFTAIRSRDIPLLRLEALMGNVEACSVLQAVEHGLAKIRTAPRHRAMLCVTCPRPVRDGDRFALAVIHGAVEQPTQAVALAICHRCGPTPGAIHAATTVGIRRFFPEARTVETTHENGGRA